MSLSIEKLARMLTADHRQVKCKLPIDMDKVKWLIDTQQEYMTKLINPMNTEEGKGWVKQNYDFLMFAMRKRRTNHINVTYSAHRKNGKKGYGRLTPNVGKSALSLHKQIRGFLFEDYCSDIDFKNMHPEMMAQLADLMGETKCASLIRKYNDNRERWFKLMIDCNPQLNRQMCKAIGYTFLYDGSIEKRFKELGLDITQEETLRDCYATCGGACTEVKKLREKIKAQFADTWKELPYNGAEHRKDAGKFSSLMQHLEHYILLKLRKKCQGDGYDVNDLQHDGLFLSEQDEQVVPSQDWLDECSEFILRETGFKLELTWKAFDVPEELREYTPAMNSDDSVDMDKVNSLVSDADTLDLNKYKYGHLKQHKLNPAELAMLGRKVAGKYVIRVQERWFIINRETGKFNHRPYSKDKYKDAICGTVLEDTHACDEIQVYDQFVFKEPSRVKEREWNTYYKELRYDNTDVEPLNTDELGKIQIILDHFNDQWCRGDLQSFEFLMKVFQDKFAHPFDLPTKPVCLVLFGLEGSGKTMPVELLFSKAFGQEFISSASSFESVTNPSGFTDQIESKLVVVMNEVPDADYNHRKMYENFKALITDRQRKSMVKYQGARDVPNNILYIATTNNKNAFRLTQTDRRYFMLDVSSSKKGDDQYFCNLAEAINEHWKLIVRYIIGYDYCQKFMNIPDNAIRRHCKNLGLCDVGEYLKQKFEDENWIPNDPPLPIGKFFQEFKLYMENEKKRSGKQAAFKGKLESLYHMVHEQRVGDKSKLMYVEDVNDLKKCLGLD